MIDFCLPDLGEGLQDARVVAWQVEAGQMVRTGEPLLSVETAKAIVDIPSPVDASVEKLCVKAEDVVNVGDTLLILDQSGNQQVPADAATTPDSDNTDSIETKQERNDSATSLGIVGTVTTATPNVLQRTTTAAKPSTDAGRLMEGLQMLKAMPGVRARANELAISLDQISGSGPGGSILNNDLDNLAASEGEYSQTVSNLATGINPAPLNMRHADSRESVRQSFRQRMTTVMQQSANSVVPATVVEMADIHLQPVDCDLTVLALQAIVSAVAQEPVLNAWFNHKDATLDIRQEVNIGIAVDTEMGLVVPVLPGADKLNGKGLREALDDLMRTVRTGTLQPSQMTGATITLSNFGSIGGMHANLVVPPPTVAIVGIGRARDLVVSKDGAIVVHPSLPVSLTFDHCSVTGGEATRFLNGLTHVFENPPRLNIKEQGDE